MKIKIFSVALATSIALCFSAQADNYNLLNPTPDNKLRPMNTERSSRSDFVTTVDPGRFQIETSLISVVKDKKCGNNCAKTTSTTLGDTTMARLGLTENGELQLVTNLYIKKRTSVSNGELEKKDGFGDANLRFKYSFSGNKSEKFGFAITPFIKFPTNQHNIGNNNIEGGVALPVAFSFNSIWTIGGMSQINFIKDRDCKKDHTHSYCQGYSNAIYISKNFNTKFYGFAEYFTYKSNISNANWQNTANFGLHYYITNNFKIDGGFNLGLTDAADDLNYYTGFAHRF